MNVYIPLHDVSYIQFAFSSQSALHCLNAFIQECSAFSNDIRNMMRLLLANQQAVPLAQMTVSPQQSAFCRTLGGIVVHTVSVIMSKVDVNLLLPFVNMLKNPASLKVQVLVV